MTAFDLGHVRAIAACGHYHQTAGRQPGGNMLAAGLEKVELVTGGRGWVQERQRLVEVTPGSLIWHLPGDRMICRSDDADPYRCLAITWAVRPQAERRVPRLTRWDDLTEILAYTRQVVSAYADDRIDRVSLALATYAHLQWRAHLCDATAGDPGLPPALQRLLQAMAREPARDWAVREMAALTGWSATTVHAGFRRHLRTSPHQHLLELRLRLARERLAAGTADLASVARACGLGSAAALCRRFRRVMGMTPGEYRERQG